MKKIRKEKKVFSIIISAKNIIFYTKIASFFTRQDGNKIPPPNNLALKNHLNFITTCTLINAILFLKINTISNITIVNPRTFPRAFQLLQKNKKNFYKTIYKTYV